MNKQQLIMAVLSRKAELEEQKQWNDRLYKENEKLRQTVSDQRIRILDCADRIFRVGRWIDEHETDIHVGDLCWFNPSDIQTAVDDCLTIAKLLDPEIEQHIRKVENDR